LSAPIAATEPASARSLEVCPRQLGGRTHIGRIGSSFANLDHLARERHRDLERGRLTHDDRSLDPLVVRALDDDDERIALTQRGQREPAMRVRGSDQLVADRDGSGFDRRVCRAIDDVTVERCVTYGIGDRGAGTRQHGRDDNEPRPHDVLVEPETATGRTRDSTQ
jgi:hypothetical protein